MKHSEDSSRCRGSHARFGGRASGGDVPGGDPARQLPNGGGHRAECLPASFPQQTAEHGLSGDFFSCVSPHFFQLLHGP